MAIQPTLKSEKWPWLDATEEDKRVPGVAGETAVYWAEKPSLAPCHKGDYREWNIGDGEHYQEQLYCRLFETFINPSGFTCECCRKQIWPAIENFRAHYLLGLDKAEQADAILAAVTCGMLTEKDALELAKELEPG